MEPSFGFGNSSGHPGPELKLPARWSIRVMSMDEETVALKVALGYGHELQLLETETPFRIDFEASRYNFMVAAKDPEILISCEVWSDVFGEFRKIKGFGGSSQGSAHFRPYPISSGSGTAF